MREIGLEVGVSTVTVSKALNGKDGVSTEVRQKILEKAAEMGYSVPGSDKCLDIGVLIPSRYFDANSFYSMLYRLVVEKMTDRGHFSLLEIITPEMEAKEQLPNLLRSRRVNGIIMLGQPDKGYIRRIVEEALPVVFLDFYEESASADAVVGDSVYGTYRLTSHLIRNGHTRIGFVGERLATSSIMDRYLGYCRAMISHGLPLREDWVIADRDKKGNLFEQMSLPAEMPTAFVCSCDLTAAVLMKQLLALGLEIPRDVSVVGFDDFCMGMEPAVPLSTFRMDYGAMAAKTVQLLEERCQNTDAFFNRVVVCGQPVYRESEGRPKE